jgi:hypothetical protein
MCFEKMTPEELRALLTKTVRTHARDVSACLRDMIYDDMLYVLLWTVREGRVTSTRKTTEKDILSLGTDRVGVTWCLDQLRHLKESTGPRDQVVVGVEDETGDVFTFITRVAATP